MKAAENPGRFRIDTHADTHHVAVIDTAGRRLADVQVPTTEAGCRAALQFLGSWNGLVNVGIECTGSYGAAVTRAVRNAGIEVVEVSPWHARGGALICRVLVRAGVMSWRGECVLP